MTKKTALEQALLESEEILKVVTENAKNMLYDQMKPVIDQNISEAFDVTGDEDKKEDEPTEAPIDAPEESPAEEPASPEGEFEAPIGDEAPAADDSIEANIETPAIDGDSAIEVPATDGEDTLDLTGATDDELISVWKKLGDDAEIQVVKNEDGTVSVNKDGDEFLIKINENEDLINEEFEQFQNGADKYDSLDEAGSTEPEKIFEIVLDENVEEAEIPVTEAPIQEEQPLEEVARTHADGRHIIRKPEGFYKYASSRTRPAVNEEKETATDKVLITEAQVLKDTNAQLLTENQTLKSDLSNHKDALRLMKENLEKVALFNSKLAFVNKIMCEHATTTDEKKTILERFDADNIVDQKDVKALYKTITTELKATIKESVEDKITTTINGTGEPLLESVQAPSQENKQLARVKEVMAYINKR
jgi:hypothetical protein